MLNYFNFMTDDTFVLAPTQLRIHVVSNWKCTEVDEVTLTAVSVICCPIVFY
ncbi:hypothetical protein Mucpa_0726 [Mucilaginibacter paludis DSM 18603]|uniref:Uncharacterized protein n=1 Tax=Mucilaginibacter paludis DSM 18603 TaxID=714943 RepID=H1Y888_9SPHI|nr:hypothetical protein Mucpa_0726 [Mucilaginibacter paludis DSM 18603]